MFPIRYIHAADLHLDAAFKGLRRNYGLTCAGGNTGAAHFETLEKALSDATFTALERLIALCQREKPHFVVLAGDIYNEEDHSLKAQLALRDACARLHALHIPVYIVHGNHDPLSSRLKMIDWPENTYIFTQEMESKVLYSPSGQAEAIIHGISHASAREGRNLAKAFSRLKGTSNDYENLFQLGILHCDVDSAEGTGKGERYAPCSLKDLHDSGLDAWALGHVHERRVLSKKPFVAYSGNTQGLHINEQDSRGCFLITATPTENIHGGATSAFDIQEEFYPLGPVVWKKINISIEGATRITEVEERLQEEMDMAAASASAHSQALMLRLTLQGRTALDGELRYKDACEELVRRLQAEAVGTPLVWLKDVQIETTPLLVMDELLMRDDLLGETLRLAEHLQKDAAHGQDFVQATLAPLFGHARARAVLTLPQGEELNKILEDAAHLCVDSMESK